MSAGSCTTGQRISGMLIYDDSSDDEEAAAAAKPLADKRKQLDSSDKRKRPDSSDDEEAAAAANPLADKRKQLDSSDEEEAAAAAKPLTNAPKGNDAAPRKPPKAAKAAPVEAAKAAPVEAASLSRVAAIGAARSMHGDSVRQHDLGSVPSASRLRQLVASALTELHRHHLIRLPSRKQVREVKVKVKKAKDYG
jgi:hypothetical protein